MSLFSKLFNKLTEYKPQNQLEELLLKAAENPLEQSTFLKKLFHFNLITLGEIVRNDDTERCAFTTTKNEQGTIYAYAYAYAYTSQQALNYVVQKNKLPPQKFVGMPALTLFEMVKGQWGICLNSGLPFGKVFEPNEIPAILSDNPASLTTTQPNSIYFGQPAKRPEKLLEKLHSHLQKQSNLNDIYFGLCYQNDKQFSYLLILDFASHIDTKDYPNYFNELGLLLNSLKSELSIELPIDMTVMSDTYRTAIQAGRLISIRNLS